MKKVLLLILIFGFSMANIATGQTQKQDFYDTDKITEIKISFAQKNWAEEMDSLRLFGDNLLLGDVVINNKSYKNVGVRYRGSRSFKTGMKRNPLFIKLNFINKKQNHQGYKTIKLSNALRDPSMVREVLGYEIARKYMAAPKANYAKVYINGTYYGLLVNVEPINGHFLKENFGSKENTFVKCSPPSLEQNSGCKKNLYCSLEYEKGAHCYLNNYELKSEDGWDDLIELTKTLTKKPKEINKVLDVDRVLWMLAFDNVLVNLNGYLGKVSQNFYLYKDDSGRFNPIVWDLNLAFGSFKNVGIGSDLKLKELQRLTPLLHEKNSTKPLISNLLVNPKYKKMYLSHIRTILYENILNGEYEKRANELQRLILVPFSNDKNKFYEISEFNKSLTSTIGKRSKIPGIVELMKSRAKYLKKNKALSVVPPRFNEPIVRKREKFDNKKVETFDITVKVDKHPKHVFVHYRYKKDGNLMTAELKDDGKHGDGAAKDGVYGVSINPKGNAKKIYYYLSGENAMSISYYPTRYMYDAIKVKLSELN